MGRVAPRMQHVASFRKSFLLSINISGWLLRREMPSWLEGASRQEVGQRVHRKASGNGVNSFRLRGNSGLRGSDLGWVGRIRAKDLDPKRICNFAPTVSKGENTANG